MAILTGGAANSDRQAGLSIQLNSASPSDKHQYLRRNTDIFVTIEVINLHFSIFFIMDDGHHGDFDI